jgi:hypothetical protein
MAERYSIYRGGDTNSKDKSTNFDDNEEEEDLLLEKELEFFSKDVNILLYGRLIKVKKEDLVCRPKTVTATPTALVRAGVEVAIGQ